MSLESGRQEPLAFAPLVEGALESRILEFDRRPFLPVPGEGHQMAPLERLSSQSSPGQVVYEYNGLLLAKDSEGKWRSLIR